MRNQRICPKSPVSTTYHQPKAPKQINVLVKRTGKLNYKLKCEAATPYTSSAI